MSRLYGLASHTPAQRLAPLGDRLHAVLRDLSRQCTRYVVTGDVAAVARGKPHAQPRLEVSYPADSPPSALASIIATWDPLPLGAPPDAPFIADDQTVAASPILALETRFGAVVLRRLDQNEFTALADSSDLLDLGGVRTLVLRLPELVAAIRRSRQASVPAIAIPALEAAAVALNRIDLRP
ncbi:MAG TPA: hypothetical protein VJO52_04555 [Gemmatimonadaceae bacterium]|nr:hypothetical protein [Gemmatimonadaceae bacterium]